MLRSQPPVKGQRLEIRPGDLNHNDWSLPSLDRPLRIVLVEDHRILRHGLRAIFGGEPDLKLVGAAANGREAIDRASESRPLSEAGALVPHPERKPASTRFKSHRRWPARLFLTRWDADPFAAMGPHWYPHRYTRWSHGGVADRPGTMCLHDGVVTKIGSPVYTAEKFPCPCCGYLVFIQPPGSHHVCPICNWEDDMSQLRFARMPGGANTESLERAQQNFADFGAATRRASTLARSPFEDERRDPEWRPLDPAVDNIEEPRRGTAYGDSYPVQDPTVLYYWRGTYWRRYAS